MSRTETSPSWTASLGGAIPTECKRNGFLPVNGSVEAGSSFALGSHKPRVPDQQPVRNIFLAGTWPDQHSLPQPPCRGTNRNSKLAFFRYQLLTWHPCFPLCTPLSFTESVPAEQLLEWVKMTFGMFSLALKDSSALFFFPQSQQNIENDLPRKCEKWFPCKLKVMSAKLIC